jgi:acetyltransferase-like isoleucine patch superfamily enzyme
LQPRLERLDRARVEILAIRSGDPLAREFAAFGEGSLIEAPRTHLLNPAAIAVGSHTHVRAGLTIEALAYQKVVVRVGDRVHMGLNVRLVAVNGIEIGDDVGVGHGVTLADTIHDWKQAKEGEASWQSSLKLGRPLVIGQGAWIGNNTVVAGGWAIGDRAIIGPNSVINRNVPADTIVAGNPAHLQRRKLPSGEWEWLVDPASLDLELRDAAQERQG